MKRAGFTLVEVVVALIVLEVAVLGVLGVLAFTAETSRRADQLERATGRVESLLDSLREDATVDSSSLAFGDGGIRWSVDSLGRLEIEAVDERGGTLLRVRSRVATLR
ncbi:MAG: prepilin-type N-terminal cleavage/methylation domain-containing protein [Gemmatimonadota bacterium]|nr:prepilin-type N-terminal cleavage/methylation domain-containing protein [Gemmatimonadota bacterium]MDH3424644.1 prepilin-type N-terminal cleavage/methylation domain-containing protein [Gemmatimonadota bacterium]